MSWNSVARWLSQSAQAASRVNAKHLRNFELVELQACEVRTLVMGKTTPTWIYTTMEVSSRSRPTSRVGSRGHRATFSGLRDVATRAMPASSRKGLAHLTRRAATHARSVQRPSEHLELLRCSYNFLRPHGALRLGMELWTPAP